MIDETVEQALTECVLGSRIRMKAILDIGNPFSGLVLDCGCGTGANSERIAKTGVDVVGVDIQLGALHLAKKRYRLSHFVQGDAGALPLKPGIFNAAICSDVLEHVQDDSKVARELNRVLVSGGEAFFTVPVDVDRRWVWVLRRFFGLDKAFWLYFYGHVREGYYTKSFLRFLKRAGFSIRTIKYCYGIFSSVAECFVIGVLRRSFREPRTVRSFKVGSFQKFLLVVYRILFPLLFLFARLDRIVPWESWKSDLAVKGVKTLSLPRS